MVCKSYWALQGSVCPEEGGDKTEAESVEIKLKLGRCWRRSGTHIDQLLLLPLGHAGQAVVLAGQVTPQAGQRGDHDVLDLPALGTGAGRGKAEPADAAPGAHPGREHVALVELPVGDLRGTSGQSTPGTPPKPKPHRAEKTGFSLSGAGSQILSPSRASSTRSCF